MEKENLMTIHIQRSQYHDDMIFSLTSEKLDFVNIVCAKHYVRIDSEIEFF